MLIDFKYNTYVPSFQKYLITSNHVSSILGDLLFLLLFFLSFEINNNFFQAQVTSASIDDSDTCADDRSCDYNPSATAARYSQECK